MCVLSLEMPGKKVEKKGRKDRKGGAKQKPTVKVKAKPAAKGKKRDTEPEPGSDEEDESQESDEEEEEDEDGGPILCFLNFLVSFVCLGGGGEVYGLLYLFAVIF
jgi:hypothetical protein